MKSSVSLLALAALALTSTAAAGKPKGLEAECRRVNQVYPLLMLTVMAEGPMDCSGSHDGSEYVDCHANETEGEKAARLRRLAIRQHQESVYKTASDACDAWAADKGSAPLREALIAAIGAARNADRGRLPAGPSGATAPAAEDPAGPGS